MKLIKHSTFLWLASIGERLVAQLHLDHMDQLKSVAVFTKNPKERLQIMQLAASHVIQYRIERWHLPSIAGIKCCPRSDRWAGVSDRVMSFSVIPDEVKRLDINELLLEMRKVIDVYDADYPDLRDMIDVCLASLESSSGIKLAYSIASHHHMQNQMVATFTASEGISFCFWHDIHADGDLEHMLYLVPPYHPALLGAENPYLINGDTDVVINERHAGFHEIKPPPESLRPSPHSIFAGDTPGFGYTKHPYKAEGRSFQLTFHLGKCQTQEGCEGTLKFLKSVLGLDNLYMAVSGGFHSPFDYPDNVLNRLDKKLPRRRNGDDRCRGSEDRCVWQYLTLEKENALEGARIPKWFHREGWLRIYGVK